MPAAYHQDVRTTLTLDDDVAAKLKATARRSGRGFREVVNETLRRGLMAERPARRAVFKVAARSLGGLRPGPNRQYRRLAGTRRGSAAPVILIDANLLIYAYDPDCRQHDASRRWLEDVLSGR
jgi:plasmid stability protein